MATGPAGATFRRLGAISGIPPGESAEPKPPLYVVPEHVEAGASRRKEEEISLYGQLQGGVHGILESPVHDLHWNGTIQSGRHPESGFPEKDHTPDPRVNGLSKGSQVFALVFPA